MEVQGRMQRLENNGESIGGRRREKAEMEGEWEESRDRRRRRGAEKDREGRKQK